MRPTASSLRIALALTIVAIPGAAQQGAGSAAADSTRRRAAHGVVDSAQLRTSNARSAADAIAGAVPGATAVTIQGTPGRAPVIVLRGAAVQQGSAPLIVIDDAVSRGTLDDLNVEDIARIEVLRGPAAAAAYGTGAANGVIRVFTRRGPELGVPGARFALRSEVSTHLRPRIIPISRHHNFQLDADGDFVLDGSGNRIPEPDGINDNPYPVSFDAAGSLLERRAVLANHFTAQQLERSGAGGLFASLRHERDPGMLALVGGFDEKAVRFNVDRSFGRRLVVDGGAFVVSSSDDLPADQGGLLSTLRFVEPHGKIDSSFTPCPIADACFTSLVPAGPPGRIPNPLRTLQNALYDNSRRRIRAGVNAAYRINDWLGARAGFTADRARSRAFSQVPLTSGARSTADGEERGSVGSVVLTATRALPRAMRNTSQVGWSSERTFLSRESALIGSSGTIAASSFERTGRIPALFVTTAFEIGPGLVVDGAVRRDQPSQFGAGVSQIFHRFGVAYQPIAGVTLRAGHGTAGADPGFDESLVSSTNPMPALSPPYVRETEAGLRASRGRLSIGYDLAVQRSVGHVMLVPAPTSSGFTLSLRNAGDVTTRAHEMSIGADLLAGSNRSWRMDLSAHRARHVMTRLHTPPFFVDRGVLFRHEAGRELNIAMGARWIRTEAQLLETIETGLLAGTAADYVRNEEGYYVRAAQHRTPDERPLAYARCTQRSGTTCTASETLFSLGRTTPDVALGLTSSSRWRAVALNATLTGAIGGIIYNEGRRADLFRQRDRVVDQSGKPLAERKPGAYYAAFLGTGPTEYLVESATHLKLRDVSLDWSVASRFGVGIVARNLVTLGSYEGHDPDVAVPSASLLYRNVDVFQYPASRTIGVVARASF